MNDPFFSASSRRKIAASNPTKKPVTPLLNKSHKQKSIKSIKTSAIIEKVKNRVSTFPLVSSAIDASNDDGKYKKLPRYAKSQNVSLDDDDDDSDTNPDEIDASAIDRDLIASRLTKDVSSGMGKRISTLGQYILADMAFMTPLFHSKPLNGGRSLLKGSPVSIDIHSESRSIFVSSKKSKGIFQWVLSEDLKSIISTRSFTTSPDSGKYPQITSIAVTPDNAYLVGGGEDSFIHIWSVSSGNYLHTLKHHRGPITGLSFRKSQSETDGFTKSDLYSISADRSLKVWQFLEKKGYDQSASNISYVDTLYGHLESPLDISVLSKERAITVGGRDRTTRLWKISESKHLIFTSPNESSSLDLVTQLTDSIFVTGSEANDLTLWNALRKRPCYSLKLDYKITALESLPYSSLFATGDQSGTVIIWGLNSGFNSFEKLTSIYVGNPCYIPGLKWIFPANVYSITCEEEAHQALERTFIAVLLSREPRLGRWSIMDSLANNQQGVYLFSFSLNPKTSSKAPGAIKHNAPYPNTTAHLSFTDETWGPHSDSDISTSADPQDPHTIQE